jgi:hypothetical protein
MLQVELKDELNMKQETCIAEVHLRLHYQNVVMNKEGVEIVGWWRMCYP